MALTHLAKGFRHISKSYGGGELEDLLAHALKGKTHSQLNSLDSSMNFTLGTLRAKGSMRTGMSSSEALDGRRSGEIIKAVLTLGSEDKTKAEDWEGDSQMGLLRSKKGQLPAKTPGYYLSAGFLAFGSANEKQYFATAWEEAKIQLRAGIRGLTQTHDPALDNLTRRWFGTSDERDMRATKKAAKKILLTIKDGMESKPLKVVYRGSNCDDSLDLQEKVGNSMEYAKTETTGWGWSSPRGGVGTIGWGQMFFDANTSNQPTRFRDSSLDAPDKMMVSRGGAVIHELSHQFADTNDNKVTAEVYEHVKRPVPDSSSKFATSYGAATCRALAATNPELAINNADNYRMFCEEMFVLFHVSRKESV